MSWDIGTDRNRCPWPCGCHESAVFGHLQPCPLAGPAQGTAISCLVNMSEAERRIEIEVS